MNVSELRQAITALKQLSIAFKQQAKYDSFLDDAVSAVDGDRTFAGYSKVSNTASNMLEDSTLPALRGALSSIAFHGYQYCVSNSNGRASFAPSRDRAETIAKSLGGPQTCSDALRAIRAYLTPSAVALIPRASDTLAEPLEVRPAVVPQGLAEHSQIASPPLFEEAIALPLGRRLSQKLLEWRLKDGEEASNDESAVFEKRFRRLLDTSGEDERQFGDFAVADDDFAAFRADLLVLQVPKLPMEILERAQACRNLAVVDFRSADASLYRSSRRCWLASAFWNSSLARLWATNEEQFVYDVLGYLTTVQAQHRYATHIEEVLLLLRVSHLICRIASSDALVPTNFYEKFGQIEAWVRYTVGTVLAISGPGRVPPSRVNNDPRLVDDDGRERNREEFGVVLLRLWRAPDERQAGCAILLELAGWNLDGATRLLRSTLGDAEAELELWLRDLKDVISRADRVKVLRPNPWANNTGGKIVTAGRHALAVLASDVIHRTFPSLESNISLNGTSFRQRRVPTFVCSADFGPLGLFKADARDRIAREADNFTRYAQRLHPRYRASRCDKSVATISEPDDRIEFVGGLLTSYVFTAREAPRSLNSWFQTTDLPVALGLVDELFNEALKPWYQHASLGTLDILSAYEVFTRAGLTRLRNGLQARADMGAADTTALSWLDDIITWISGERASVDAAIEDHAAQLQLCETLRAVTHGDLHLDNVMVLGRPGSEYPCLIDFETTSEAHLLRDFGRFAGAVLFRTCNWDGNETRQIRAALGRGIASEYAQLAPKSGSESNNVAKALDVVDSVWRSYLQYWRGNSRPSRLEVVATLVCSFLPFARYPDTAAVSADLALSLAGDLIRDLSPTYGGPTS